MFPRKTLFTLFFFSGFCGLLYQVVWVRIAFAHFGVIAPVLSVIISVFMLGLALGSWAAGKWGPSLAARLKVSSALLYATVEFFTGLGAFAVPAVFIAGSDALLNQGAMDSFKYLALSAGIIASAVLPSCLCMGATFPLMMAYIKERDPQTKASFSFLYLANVLGAVTGAILTADVLVELFGFRQTLVIAGLINFAIAAVSLRLARAPAGRRANAAIKVPDYDVRLAEKPRRIMTILFATGFTSMAMEVVWTRGFTAILGTTIYAFAIILAVYLAATALGSALYRRDLRGGKSLGVAELLAALSSSVFFPLLVNDPRLRFGPLGVQLSLIPFCAVLGYLTPKLIDQFSRGDPDHAGRAYAINVAGCVLGPLAASYLLLPWGGVKNALFWLGAVYIALSVPYWKRLPSRWKPAVGFGVVCALIGGLVSRSYEERYAHAVVLRDYAATVIATGAGKGRALFVNGTGITSLTTITKEMAHFPLALRPKPPTAVLDICFGMGTTYRSLLTWNVPTTSVELVPSVPKMMFYFHDDAEAVLKNPLGEIIIDDGRRYLMRTSKQFDLISIDPPPPVEAAASSLLYSKEFYTLAKRRLTPSGIVAQWFPGGEGRQVQAITRSMRESFPYVVGYRSVALTGLHLFGSREPITIPSVEEFIRRLPPAARKDLMEWETGTLKEVVQRTLDQQVSVVRLTGRDPHIVVTDDRPFNEYYLLRRLRTRLTQPTPS